MVSLQEQLLKAGLVDNIELSEYLPSSLPAPTDIDFAYIQFIRLVIQLFIPYGYQFNFTGKLPFQVVAGDFMLPEIDTLPEEFADVEIS